MSAPTTRSTRNFEHSIVLDVPAEVVWRAISEGEGLKRWFPIDARVSPPSAEKPGSVFLSWGPSCEGEAPITIWQPQKVLGWREDHGPGADGLGPVQIAADFRIEPGEGGQGTILRVVQSGFAKGDRWDDMYDSISNGWKYEFLSLKHALERHADQPRRMFWEPTPCELSTAQAWDRISRDGALVKGIGLDGHKAGETVRFASPAGTACTGQIMRTIDSRSFVASIRELDDALLRIEIERSGAKSTPFVSLSIWGPKRDRLDELRREWRAGLESALA